MIAGLLMLQSVVPSTSLVEREVVVTARRSDGLPGEIVEDVIVPRSIKALAADSIAELLDKLRNRYGNDLSIVVDGRRLGSIDAVAELPPEALSRIEVLRPGKGGRFGYSGSTKVLNLVLRPKFDSVTAEGTTSAATEGGAITESVAGRYARIRNGRRLNGSIQYRGNDGLLESQRIAVAPSLAGDTSVDEAASRYRNLIPRSRDVGLTAGLALPIRSANFDVTLSAGTTGTRSLAGLYRFGFDGGDGAATIVQRNSSRYVRASTGLSGTVNRMFWSVMANGDLSRSTSASVRQSIDLGENGNEIDTISALPAAPALQSAKVDTANLSLKALAGATVGHLPAGDLRMGGNITASRSSVLSSSAGQLGSASVSSSRLSIQANAEMPLINRDVAALAWLGAVNLDMDFEYTTVSRQADAASGQAVLNWALSPGISFAVSKSYQEIPPSISSLFSVPVAIPGSLIYDDRAAMVVPVTLVTGGNPDIRKQSRSEERFRLAFGNDGRGVRIAGSISYVMSKTANPLLSFSEPSALVEASVPASFVRDSGGRLIQYDARSFSGKARTSSSLMADVHVFGSVQGKPDTRGAENGRPSNSEIAWDMSVTYEFAVRDRITLESGQPPIDTLKTPLSLAPGTLARHRLNVQTAVTVGSYGINLGGSWQSGFRGVDIDDRRSPVSFSSLTVVRVEGFLDLGRSKEEANASKIRIKLAVDNLFNQRFHNLALSQPAYRRLGGSLLDPLGRVVRVSIRKVF